jgi:flagellar basal body-associated protein FliL
MDLKSKKIKSLILLFSSIGLFALVIFLVMVPFIKKVYKQKDLLEESKLTSQRDRQNIEKYKKDLEYFKSNAFLNEDLNVSEDNRIKIIKGLEKIAFDQNLKQEIETYVSTINIKKNASAEESKTSLKIVVEGDYMDFMIFFHKLQNFKYAVSVESLTIEAFDESKIKNLKDPEELKNLPEIVGEIIVTFI